MPRGMTVPASVALTWLRPGSRSVVAEGVETTSRLLAPSSEVALPAITCVGAVLPLAPGANSSTWSGSR